MLRLRCSSYRREGRRRRSDRPQAADKHFIGRPWAVQSDARRYGVGEGQPCAPEAQSQQCMFTEQHRTWPNRRRGHCVYAVYVCRRLPPNSCKYCHLLSPTVSVHTMLAAFRTHAQDSAEKFRSMILVRQSGPEPAGLQYGALVAIDMSSWMSSGHQEVPLHNSARPPPRNDIPML